MIRLLLLPVLLTAPILAAPIPKEQPKAKLPNYFPCEFGTKWEYESADDRTVVEVTKVRHEKDCKFVTLTHSRPGTTATSEYLYLVTNEAVVGLGTGRNEGQEYRHLSFPWKAGDTWSVNHQGFGTLDTVVLEPSKVKVPAGNYEAHSISITLRGTPVTDFEIREYYADGVGRIMVTGYKPDMPPSVLKKFTPAPK